MDDFDSRLRSRLISLAMAAASPAEDQTGPTMEGHRPRVRSAMPTGLLAAGVLVTLGLLLSSRLTWWSNSSGAGGPPPSETASIMPSTVPLSPLPSGGISRDKAIAVAKANSRLTTLASVEAGRFGDLSSNPNPPDQLPISPDSMVWAVTLKGDVGACDPQGHCYSPSPEIDTLYVDYFSGALLWTEAVSSAP
jgi:hypothetical protein